VPAILSIVRLLVGMVPITKSLQRTFALIHWRDYEALEISSCEGVPQTR
jgi:hypothetical protein